MALCPPPPPLRLITHKYVICSAVSIKYAYEKQAFVIVFLRVINSVLWRISSLTLRKKQQQKQQEEQEEHGRITEHLTRSEGEEGIQKKERPGRDGESLWRHEPDVELRDTL